MSTLYLAPRLPSDKTALTALWPTPFGTIELMGSTHALHSSRFIDMSPNGVTPLPTPWKKLHANLWLQPSGTPFQYKVWQALMRVKLGQTISYKALAAQLGQSAATRAVANAVAANPLPGFIPCHRVIRSDGALGGYSQGIDRKQQLLAAEQKGQSLHEFC